MKYEPIVILTKSDLDGVAEEAASRAIRKFKAGEWLTLSQAAEELKVKQVATVTGLIKNGELGSNGKEGKRCRVSLAQIDEYFNNNPLKKLKHDR